MYTPSIHPPKNPARILPFLALLLYGCSATSSYPENAITHEDQRDNIQKWHLDECQLIHENEHVTFRTDGRKSHQTIRLAMRLEQAAQKVPLVSVVGIPTRDLNLTGRNKQWSFELPTTPHASADMLTGNAYIVTEYTPELNPRFGPRFGPESIKEKAKPTPKKAVVSLKNLPSGLLKLYQRCAE